jgi:hypothetical protein
MHQQQHLQRLVAHVFFLSFLFSVIPRLCASKASVVSPAHRQLVPLSFLFCHMQSFLIVHKLLQEPSKQQAPL